MYMILYCWEVLVVNYGIYVMDNMFDYFLIRKYCGILCNIYLNYLFVVCFI